MIVAKTADANEEDFKLLLQKATETLIVEIKKVETPSPLNFENQVFQHMIIASEKTIFFGKIEQTSLHAFPDIVAKNYFGVEVKMTEKDQWISTGNSILESTRIETVQRIYILFGKFGGRKEIKFRLYQECLPDISVTHSPRYRIDMNLPVGKSIFDKIGIEYDVLRNDSNQIKLIKAYYRTELKPGEELWWIDGEQRQTLPIIRPLSSFDSIEREMFIVEVFVLFPEIFSNCPTKFERVAAYLISEYSAVSANIRDHFTAGGTEKIPLRGKTTKVSRIIYNLFSLVRKVKKCLNTISDEKLQNYWRLDNIKPNRIDQWLAILKQFQVSTENQNVIKAIFSVK